MQYHSHVGTILYTTLVQINRILDSVARLEPPKTALIKIVPATPGDESTPLKFVVTLRSEEKQDLFDVSAVADHAARQLTVSVQGAGIKPEEIIIKDVDDVEEQIALIRNAIAKKYVYKPATKSQAGHAPATKSQAAPSSTRKSQAAPLSARKSQAGSPPATKSQTGKPAATKSPTKESTAKPARKSSSADITGPSSSNQLASQNGDAEARHPQTVVTTGQTRRRVRLRQRRRSSSQRT